MVRFFGQRTETHRTDVGYLSLPIAVHGVNHTSLTLFTAHGPRDSAAWNPEESSGIVKHSAVSPTTGENPDVRSPVGKHQEFGDLLSAVAVTHCLENQGFSGAMEMDR